MPDPRPPEPETVAQDTAQRVAFNAPAFVGNELRYIEEAIALRQLSGDGHFTRRCNAWIERQTGGAKALLTHSCTAALEMSAILADLGAGDEVIMPSFTFVSTANAVVLRGATPVFVDIRRDTLNIDPAEVARAITPRTRALMVVHYAGFPADMDALTDIARAHDLVLIEDAAQALGATYKGRPAGSFGDLACFSFHETKNIVSGEGGAIVVNDPALVERAEVIREKGTNRSRFLRGQVDKYTWTDIGSSFLPGELIASFLFGQLEKADEITERRRAYYDTYRRAFADLAEAGRVTLPPEQPDCEGNGHLFYLLLPTPGDRDAFIAHMSAHQVATPFHYVPLHDSPYGRKVARAVGDLAVTRDVSARLVRLPLFWSLMEQQDRVIDLTRAYFGK